MNMCQASSRPARRAELDPTLDGIVEKLRMLRAEIDATLVDLIIYNSQHGATASESRTRTAAPSFYPTRRVAPLKAAAAHARILRMRFTARFSAARIAAHELMERTSRLLHRPHLRARLAAPLPSRKRVSVRQAGPRDRDDARLVPYGGNGAE